MFKKKVVETLVPICPFCGNEQQHEDNSHFYSCQGDEIISYYLSAWNKIVVSEDDNGNWYFISLVEESEGWWKGGIQSYSTHSHWNNIKSALSLEAKNLEKRIAEIDAFLEKYD